MNYCFIKRGFVVMILLLVAYAGEAQNILNKNLSIEANRQRLADVLEVISNKGNFYFSYNSALVKKDSLVSVAAANGKTVREILNSLFPQGYEFRESGNYLI